MRIYLYEITPAPDNTDIGFSSDPEYNSVSAEVSQEKYEELVNIWISWYSIQEELRKMFLTNLK